MKDNDPNKDWIDGNTEKAKGLSKRLKANLKREKNYLCRHPTCHKKFFTKEEMLKHYYPVHEGHPYDPKEERKERDRYRERIISAERGIAIEKERKSYEIAGVDEVHIQSKRKYLRPPDD